MAIYSICFIDPTAEPGQRKRIHELGAKSDAEARIRFMNLSWVAFTAISIDSIALKADQPEEAKEAARKASRAASKGKGPGGDVIAAIGADKAERVMRAPLPKPVRVRAEDSKWRADVDRLTEEIGKLADKAQALTRKGKHDDADKLRAQAKQLAADRAAITKRNRGK